MKVYIGYDERERAAYEVACRTLWETSRIVAQPIDAVKCAAQGLLTRTSDHRGGQDYDLVSNAPKSTRFAVSRFLAPILCQSGPALFCDCDVVFLSDVRDMLLHLRNEDHAVWVVKHNHRPTEQWKMVNQVQTAYPRKNWSSVMLFDCDHPANHRLTLWDVNHRPGRDLHAFYWLHDEEIGALDPAWNWLVGVQPKPAAPKIAHFTLGGPWLPGWKSAEHDDIWQEAAR
jgi:hypothetical protein